MSFTDDSLTVYIVCISPQMNKNSTTFTEKVRAFSFCGHTRKSFHLILVIFPQQWTVPNYASTSPSVSREAMSLGINLQDPPSCAQMCPLPHLLCFTLPDNLMRPTLVPSGRPGASPLLRAEGGDKEMDCGAGGCTPFSKVSAEGLNDEAGKIENIGACRSGTNEGFFFYTYLAGRIVGSWRQNVSGKW